jgi:class 3 adenylate cyclase
VTFLFADIEESTRRWDADAPATEALVAAHDNLVRTVVEGHEGYVFTTMGDGFAVAFQRASEPVAAAVESQESLAGEERVKPGVRVRMGLHIGEAVERDALGPDAARLLAEGASWSVAEATQAAEETLGRLQADSKGPEPARRRSRPLRLGLIGSRRPEGR